MVDIMFSAMIDIMINGSIGGSGKINNQMNEQSVSIDI